MGPIFQVANLNRNRTQFMPSETHCQPDPTERNRTQFMPSETHCQPDPTERNRSLRHVTTRNVKDLSTMCFDRLVKQP